MDRDWIKSLATADFTSGSWRVADEEAIKQRATREILTAMDEIYEGVVEAVDIFNAYSQQNRDIKLMPLHHPETHQLNGLVMIVGSVQLRMEHQNFQFIISVYRRQEYRTKVKPLHILEPRIDPFGGLTWIMDHKTTLTRDLIVKQLLRDICTTSFVGVESKKRWFP